MKVDPSKGEEKSTVDHFNPISGAKGKTVQEIRKMFDVKSNFLLAEEGPNQARQENEWGGWVDKTLKKNNKGTTVKLQSAPKTVIERPNQSARKQLTSDQKSQLRSAVSRMGRLQGEVLSESEALSRLTPAQRTLFKQFM